MRNKNIIKSILFEGSQQVSAVLPRQLDPQSALNTFVYKVPIILNKSYFIKDENIKKVDYFKIIFYKDQSFNNDFNSNFYNGTIDFKKFNVNSERSDNLLFGENFKNIAKGFYQDGNLTNQHYNVNFKESSIVDNDLYIYNITLSNSISKEIKDENYSCMRIFAIKNNNIIDDTDFVFFENDNFLKNVYDTKKVYDLQYFINEVYLSDFSDSLSLRLPDSSSIEVEQLGIVKSSQFDSNIVTGSVNINVDFENTTPITVTQDEMSINSFIDNSIIEVSNNSFFNNIIKKYLMGLEIFVFRIQCIFSIRRNLGENVQDDNTGIIRTFEKQRTFSRSDSFIRQIVSRYKNQYLTRLYNRCNFSLKASATSRHIEVILKAENDITERSLLSLFKINAIKKNNKSYNDGELFSASNLSINDKLNFIDLNIEDLTSNNEKAFKFFIPNDTINIFTKVRVSIISTVESFSERFLESELIIINPDYENLFNRLNKSMLSAINIETNGLSRSASIDGFFTSYNKIKINNVERRFGDIAYNFGYYDQQSSQNTQSTSDILDFFKSSVFSFEVEESLDNIENAKFKKKSYFFGNQIIKNESIENDSLELKRSFINTYLSTDIDSILSNSVVKNNESINTIRAIRYNTREDNQNNGLIPVDVIKFLNENNFLLTKKIKIKVIPIPKLIKLYQSQADLDDKLNLVFPSEVSNDIKNYININFVDLFYDKNSSLNWNRFLRFKKLYFKKEKNSSEIMSSASYLSSIWDYLSSNIYIDDSNVFANKEVFTKEDLEKNIFSEEPEILEDAYRESEFLVQSIKLRKISTNSYFEDYSNKYFNFKNNNKELIFVENDGMLINFKGMNEEITKPNTIEIVNTNLNKEKRIDLDITGLKKYFSKQDISRMNFLVKLSIHPLLRNKAYAPVKNTNLTKFINTNLSTSQQSYVTQNNNYMSENLKSYFFEYNNPINNLNSKIYESGEKLKLSLYLGKNRKNISSLTFKELFNFCINNNTNILKDFYLRVGFSFEINNNYYYANIYKKIDRNNLNNSLVEINRVESIKEI